MFTKKLIIFFILINAVSAQFTIPSWAQWLSDDQKEMTRFTSNVGCKYAELDIPSLYRVKQEIVNEFLKEGFEFQEEDIQAALEMFWDESTANYPIRHIEDGYRMIKIIDASEASDVYKEWGKVVQWEWQFKLENISSQDLKVRLKYQLADKDGIRIAFAEDGGWSVIGKGETTTLSKKNFFPIEYLDEVKGRTWSISLDY